MGIFSNMRKPKGKLGNIQLKSMNKEHTPVSLWGLKHLDINPDDIVLDIGCGGGININRMAKKAKMVYKNCIILRGYVLLFLTMLVFRGVGYNKFSSVLES